MSEYITIQTGKIVSAYGGIGSIIETRKGAFIVEDFDKWLFYRDNLHTEPEYEIEDTRLIKRLRFHFKKLKQLFRVPQNTASYGNRTKPADPKQVISASYFPRWMYCPRCKRFRPLDEWWKSWCMVKHGWQPRREDFVKPKCYACYENARRSMKSGKRQKYYYELEQVRFIMTSPRGDIQDIPWERWPALQRNAPRDDGEGTLPIKLDYDRLCCEKQDLRYIPTLLYADLSGITIKCENCGKSSSLAGLFGLRCGKKENLYKPVIRSSNSVFYPLTINSIYLPMEQDIEKADQDYIKKMIEDGDDEETICARKSLREKYSQDIILDYVRSVLEANEKFEPEIIYRRNEFNFIINNSIQATDKSTDFRQETQDTSSLREYGIRHLIILKRIKMVTVQTAYTRQEPMDRDTFLQNLDVEEAPQIKFKYTSKMGKNAEYLPAVESFGEGIFIDLDAQKVDDWYNECRGNFKEFRERIELIIGNISKSRFISSSHFREPMHKHLARFILVHTFSHILIKELEFLVGYSSTSLSERLFVDENRMQGLLIYTIAGTEGSYGGLISQGAPEKFKKILKSALHRARDCASDPVCTLSEGQGIGGLNLSACYSCTLLPETSCEEFNSFLDRRLLIDREFGFFKDDSFS